MRNHRALDTFRLAHTGEVRAAPPPYAVIASASLEFIRQLAKSGLGGPGTTGFMRPILGDVHQTIRVLVGQILEEQSVYDAEDRRVRFQCLFPG